MTINNRIELLINYLSLNNNSFSIKIGVNPTVIHNIIKGRNAPSYDIIQKIILSFDNINTDWLITGKGDMIQGGIVGGVDNKKAAPVPRESYPLIPVDAMAGYGGGDVQVMDYEISEAYSVPDFNNKGVKFLIRVSGSSMIPKYNNGDLLACRPISDLSFIQWGKVHVMDTEQGPIVKRLFPGLDGDHMECRSDNKENYPPFQIPLASVRKVALVVGVIRLE